MSGLPGNHPKRDGDCPQCGAPFTIIIFRDNHGDEEILEGHCNQCGYAIGGEGELRREGRTDLRNVKAENGEFRPSQFLSGFGLEKARPPIRER